LLGNAIFFASTWAVARARNVEVATLPSRNLRSRSGRQQSASPRSREVRRVPRNVPKPAKDMSPDSRMKGTSDFSCLLRLNVPWRELRSTTLTFPSSSKEIRACLLHITRLLNVARATSSPSIPSEVQIAPALTIVASTRSISG